MFKPWSIGSISGIPVRIHWTFLLLPIWIYFSSLFAGSGFLSAIFGVVFLFAIFGCVLLHEFGHALAARQFGIATRSITLLPIGGVAALERMPKNPFQELWIAVAGPLVNVAIAVLLLPIIFFLSHLFYPPVQNFLFQLLAVNIILVVFNMIPAFPMDGGRVLRSILAMFMNWVEATRIAVTVGKISAVGLGLLGIFSGNLILVLVAAFVYFAAHSELMMANASQMQTNSTFGMRQPFAQSTFENRSASFENRPDQEETSGFCSVPSTLSTGSVAAWLTSKRAEYCRVIENGREIGILSKNQLLGALARGLSGVAVGELLHFQQT